MTISGKAASGLSADKTAYFDRPNTPGVSAMVIHSGEAIGFRTRVERFLELKFTEINLANRVDAKLNELPHQIADLVLCAGQP